MTKLQAVALLGGSVTTAADELGVTRQAVEKWPDLLPIRIADRVRGAWARKNAAPMLQAATDTSTEAQAAQGVANA